MRLILSALHGNSAIRPLHRIVQQVAQQLGQVIFVEGQEQRAGNVDVPLDMLGAGLAAKCLVQAVNNRARVAIQ